MYCVKYCHGIIYFYLGKCLRRTEGHRLVSPGGAEVELCVGVQWDCAQHLATLKPLKIIIIILIITPARVISWGRISWCSSLLYSIRGHGPLEHT